MAQDPAMPMKQNTGDAKIERTGHTSSPHHGANTNAKAIMRSEPTDERVK